MFSKMDLNNSVNSSLRVLEPEFKPAKIASIGIFALGVEGYSEIMLGADGFTPTTILGTN